MTLQFGPPTDPRYVNFKQGAQQANNDLADGHRWRWAPGHGKWLTYSNREWILDDVGIPDTTPSMSVSFTDDSSLESDLFLPKLFERVDEIHAKYRGRWPDTTDGGRGGLVWTWRGGGDWRVAIPRHGQDGGTDDDVTIPPECLQRIEDVREYERRRLITPLDAQRLIKEIVADCTVG